MYGREYLIEMEVRAYREAVEKARAKAYSELSEDARERVREQDASHSKVSQELVNRFEQARLRQDQQLSAAAAMPGRGVLGGLFR